MNRKDKELLYEFMDYVVAVVVGGLLVALWFALTEY